MRLVKRWGVMTLVALLVLGTMGAAFASDTGETETETAKEPPGQGVYGPDDGAPVLEWADELMKLVFFWGYDEEDLGTENGPECPVAKSEELATSYLFGGSAEATEVGECLFLNVEKNGHVNHGSMVSAVVHWLKDGGMAMLSDEYQDMPRGQLVKMFAQNEFGKGFFDLDEYSSVDAESLDADSLEDEESDGHGPPAWVKEKKAEKAAEKAAKGKNK